MVTVPTPCINVCTLDEATGLCLGCARSGAEIAAWAEADAGFKRGVWRSLPHRRGQLNVSAWRLPWSADEIAAFVEASLRERSGRWTLGAHGACVSFAIGAGETVEIARTPDAVTAVTECGALRLLKHEKTMAIAFGSAADPLGPGAIGLVLPRGRVSLREGARPDEAAIVPAYRSEWLRPLTQMRDAATRLYLRAPKSGVIAEPPDIAAAMLDGRTHLVVETGLGRAEIFTSNQGSDREGAAFDLRAEDIEGASELPPAWTLDRVFALGALFYPQRHPGWWA